MPQPPSYNREKDFSEDFGSETDHSALNAELDKASNSINDIRTNLAILQADDGKLNPDVITADSISEEVRAELSAGIVDAVGGSVAEAAASASAAAASELALANAVTVTTANKVSAAASEAAALASKNASDTNAASALASKNAAQASESNVTTLAAAVASNKAATDANAASSLANKNASAASASVAAQSAVEADASAFTAANQKAAAQVSAAAALVSQNAAAASAASIDPPTLVRKTVADTGASISPAGTTAQRPPAPQEGWERFNTSTKQKEVWNGTAWAPAGGGATGGGADKIFIPTGNKMTADFVMTEPNYLIVGELDTDIYLLDTGSSYVAFV